MVVGVQLFVELFVAVVVVVLGVEIDKLTIVVLLRGETRVELVTKCFETPLKLRGDASAVLVWR